MGFTQIVSWHRRQNTKKYYVNNNNQIEVSEATNLHTISTLRHLVVLHMRHFIRNADKFESKK